MKKNIIIVIILGIFIGYLFGNLIYKNYAGIEYLESDGNIYYVQYGVYTTNEAAISNSLKLDNYIIKELDEKYYVYLGITTSYNNALKIQNMYLDNNIYSYIRDDYVKNSETLNILKAYDEKINEYSDFDNIKSVIKEIFENKELNL